MFAPALTRYFCLNLMNRAAVQKCIPHNFANCRGISTCGNLLGRMLFSENHEYLDIKGNKAKIGITDHAQKELGDVVYVELPEITGDSLRLGEVACSVESVKAVAEVYMPISGILKAVNEQLSSSPELVNSAPYSDGWLVEVEITQPDELESLMDQEAYDQYLSATE